MKDFLKYTLATIVGIVLLSLFMGIFTLLTFSGLAAMGSSTETVADNSVMVLKLDGSLAERSQEDPFGGLLGDMGSIGLDQLLTAVKSAKENDKIKGIYMECGKFSGATPAMLQELHDALADFKTSGKFILAYGDNYSQGEYYLASLADSIMINPQGMIELVGLSSQIMYYKKLLDKVGVKMQVFKVGKFKSAVEPFLQEDISDANREQMETFTQEIWDEMLQDMSQARKIKKAEFNQMVDSALFFKPAQCYKKHRLVDKLAYSTDVPQSIANMMGCDKGDYVTASVEAVAAEAQNQPKSMSGNLIAVYYACGEIVQSSSTTSFSSEPQIVGEKVVKDLKKLAEDDNVKAVVLRVNSPGGSAYASEQIWNQVMNIKSKKPIVVSMGGYAASGGYYISCAADWIVAEPTTLTGSIGIFGMFPEVSELAHEKLGLNIATVKTNKFGDFGDMFRPMNEGESQAMQGYINRGYELFTKRCADGRKISQDSIKVIAEGRVWTGKHAKKIGLVDQLGSLEDAIAVAKKRVKVDGKKVDDFTICTYPASPSFFEQLLAKTVKNNYADGAMKENLGEFYDLVRQIRNVSERDQIQAALPYIIRFNL